MGCLHYVIFFLFIIEGLLLVFLLLLAGRIPPFFLLAVCCCTVGLAVASKCCYIIVVIKIPSVPPCKSARWPSGGRANILSRGPVMYRAGPRLCSVGPQRGYMTSTPRKENQVLRKNVVNINVIGTRKFGFETVLVCTIT